MKHDQMPEKVKWLIWMGNRENLKEIYLPLLLIGIIALYLFLKTGEFDKYSAVFFLGAPTISVAYLFVFFRQDKVHLNILRLLFIFVASQVVGYTLNRTFENLGIHFMILILIASVILPVIIAIFDIYFNFLKKGGVK